MEIKTFEPFRVEESSRRVRFADERANSGATVERNQICGEVIGRASRRCNDRPVADQSPEHCRLVAVPDDFRETVGIAFLDAGQRRRGRAARPFRQRLAARCRQFAACVLACAFATNSLNLSAVMAISNPFPSLPNAITGMPILVWPVSTMA